jgi:hypothetical protein
MANFLLIYHGGSEPTSAEEGERVMAAWTGWFGRLGAAVVDGGQPIAGVRTVNPNGNVSDGASNAATGYSILSAASLDAAVELAKGCPHLASGGSVEVAETNPIM